jgi:hypothetical protein
VRILDKPADRSIKTVWGVAAWSGAFSRFCAEWDAEQERHGAGERVLGHTFEAARRAGLIVDALVLEGGIFLDVGTPQGLRGALQRLAERGVLERVQAALGLDGPA